MSSSTFVIVVDGVLRKPATNAVIEQGQALYWALQAAGRVILLCGEDKDKVDWFLRTNGFTKHVQLIAEDSTVSPTVLGRRLQQIRQVRSSGTNVAFVIEPDPRVALGLFTESIPTLAYLHPVFMQPAFRPGYKSTATPWEDLIKEFEYQERSRAENAYNHEEVAE